MIENETTYPFWIEEAPPGEPAKLGLGIAFVEEIKEEFVGMELARPGSRLAAGDTLGILYTGTRALDLRLPFAISLASVNAEALADPRLVKLSPYGRGWLAMAERLA